MFGLPHAHARLAANRVTAAIEVDAGSVHTGFLSFAESLTTTAFGCGLVSVPPRHFSVAIAKRSSRSPL